jgi:hypothetical protein
MGKQLDFYAAVAREIAEAMFSSMNKSGEVEVQASDSGKSIEIVRLLVGEERAGFGTKAMLSACQLADSRGVPLELTPDGSYYEDEESAQSRLVSFYSRFGFVDSGYGTMVRAAIKQQSHPRMRM